MLDGVESMLAKGTMEKTLQNTSKSQEDQPRFIEATATSDYL